MRKNSNPHDARPSLTGRMFPFSHPFHVHSVQVCIHQLGVCLRKPRHELLFFSATVTHFIGIGSSSRLISFDVLEQKKKDRTQNEQENENYDSQTSLSPSPTYAWMRIDVVGFANSCSLENLPLPFVHCLDSPVTLLFITRAHRPFIEVRPWRTTAQNAGTQSESTWRRNIFRTPFRVQIRGCAGVFTW